MQQRDDPGSDVRRKIVKRATLYTASFIGAALGIAVVGAAVVAWLLTFAGQPFRRTWLVLTVIIVLPGLLAALVRLIRER